MAAHSIPRPRRSVKRQNLGAAVPNWADVRPQETHRTQSNSRRFADWRRLCALCVLCLFSTPQWVVGHQALATSRRVERLSENRTVPTGYVRFANDHKLLYGNICSMSKTGYVAKIRPAFSATNFTNLHESSFCLRGNSCHSWQKSARRAAPPHRLDPVAIRVVGVARGAVLPCFTCCSRFSAS